MNLMAFALIFTAFCALCLGDGRYASRIAPGLNVKKPTLFRLAGWFLLAGSLPAAIAANGVSIGLAMWFGLVSLGAGIVVLFLAYAPALLRKAGR